MSYVIYILFLSGADIQKLLKKIKQFLVLFKLYLIFYFFYVSLIFYSNFN